MKKRKINYGHMGNGLTVWDSLNEKYGDYEKIAHIDHDRTITFYTKNLTEEEINNIIELAKTDNSSCSISQPEKKVFSILPTDNKLQSCSKIY